MKHLRKMSLSAIMNLACLLSPIHSVVSAKAALVDHEVLLM